MRLHRRWLRGMALLFALVAAVACPRASLAVGIDDYQLTRSFALPAPGPASGGNVLLDPLPDGRLLLLNGTTVSVETAVQSGSFTAIGDIPGFSPGFGPSFLTVSPNGARAAAGSNGAGSIVVFDTSNPSSVTSYAAFEFTGRWIDDQRLAIANFGTVDVLDTSSATLTNVIANIGGASAGVAIDAAGNLYTGNGYDTAAGGSDTGWIKAFAAADWQNALATSTPLDFEATGVLVADLLSAYPIGFDASGNMYVGGADFFGGSGDLGYAALIAADAVADALASPQATPPITSASPASVLRKFPSPQSTIDNLQPPNWNFNAATGELYLGYYQVGDVDVYAVPEPATFVLAICGLMAMAVIRGRPSRDVPWGRGWARSLAILTMLASAAACSSASAALLVSDSFDYPNGGLVANSGGNWTSFSAGSAASAVQVVGGVVTGIQHGEGSRQDIQRVFSDSPITAGTVYARFSLQVTNAPSAPWSPGDAKEEFTFTFAAPAGNAASRRGWLYVASPDVEMPGAFRLGVSNLSVSGSNHPHYTSNLTVGDWYHVILATSAVDNTSKLWVGQTLAFDENSPTVVDNAVPATIQGLTKLMVFQQGAIPANENSLNFDNLRIGTSFAAVIPEPASAVLLAAAVPWLLRGRRRLAAATVPLGAVAVLAAAGGSPAAAQSPYAVELISQNGAYGNQALYNDPYAVLGEPTRIAQNAAFPPVGNLPFHIKIVEPAYNRDLDGNKLITTLARKPGSGPDGYDYGSITVKFDHRVYDDPANPYGIDLNVFGNAFYVGGGTTGGYVSDAIDMRAYFLAGGIFAEPVIVSVSPDNENWYTYAAGPYGDTAFPTQGYEWSAEQHDATGNGWTDEKMDFTKPVNPTLDAVLGTQSPRVYAADALQMYVGSGGGTGIDLAESGFEWIQYVRVESTAEFRDGEIDAFADVRPMRVGEALSITPANVVDGTRLFFQNPVDESRSAVIAEFTSIADLGKLATSNVTDEVALAVLSSENVLADYQLDVSALVGRGAVDFTVDYRLRPGLGYEGDGSDLAVLSWIDDAWTAIPFAFDATTGMALLKSWSQASSLLAITQAAAGVPGDYDDNGLVDGADFLVWQRQLGNSIALPNEAESPGVVDAADLDVWKLHFGQAEGDDAQVVGVPEPATFVLALLLVGGRSLAIRRREA